MPWSELNKKPDEVVIVSGIGQAAKAPHYLRCNNFNGLHGRTLPVATGIKLANHELTVLAEGGDGDGFAEGGNHFIHAMRRNIDITYLVHNNQVYGLTKGQTSPTSDLGYVSKTTPVGSPSPPMNPLLLAIASGLRVCGTGICRRSVPPLLPDPGGYSFQGVCLHRYPPALRFIQPREYLPVVREPGLQDQR